MDRRTFLLRALAATGISGVGKSKKPEEAVYMIRDRLPLYGQHCYHLTGVAWDENNNCATVWGPKQDAKKFVSADDADSSCKAWGVWEEDTMVVGVRPSGEEFYWQRPKPTDRREPEPIAA